MIVRNGNAWIAALLLALAPAAQASVLVRQTTQQLADEAQLVVRGTVLSQDESVDPAVHSRVVHTTVQVAETWKGKAPGTITVQQLGHLVDGKQSGIPGDAVFTRGEEVVLFLASGVTPGTSSTFFLVGLGQGKFHIDRTAKGAPAVTREVGGAHYVKGSSTPAPATLQELKRAVIPHRRSAR